MLRQGLFALVMMVLCVAFVAADTIKGRISKIDDKSLTIHTSKKDKDGKTYDIAKGVKVFRLVTKDDKTEKEEVKDGLKAEVFTKISDKGINNVTIETDKDNKVIEIGLGMKKKAAN